LNNKAKLGKLLRIGTDSYHEFPTHCYAPHSGDKHEKV